MDIRPASDVLIVKEFKPEEGKTPGGLFIPQSVQDNDTLMKGEIIAAGPGETNKAGNLLPNPYTKGDIIVYEKRRALPVTYDGKEYVFINATQVFGTVDVTSN